MTQTTLEANESMAGVVETVVITGDLSKLEPSQRVLADYGNMSSPTVLFVVDELRKRGNWLPCILLAFGPGLSIEAALLV